MYIIILDWVNLEMLLLATAESKGIKFQSCWQNYFTAVNFFMSAFLIYLDIYWKQNTMFYF